METKECHVSIFEQKGGRREAANLSRSRQNLIRYQQVSWKVIRCHHSQQESIPYLHGAGPSSFGPKGRTPFRLFCVLSTAQLYSSILAPGSVSVSRISLSSFFPFSSRCSVTLSKTVSLSIWQLQSTDCFIQHVWWWWSKGTWRNYGLYRFIH